MRTTLYENKMIDRQLNNKISNLTSTKNSFIRENKIANKLAPKQFINEAINTGTKFVLPSRIAQEVNSAETSKPNNDTQRSASIRQ